MKSETLSLSPILQEIEQLKSAHKLISEVYIPKIEQYLLGMSGAGLVTDAKIEVCIYWFQRFAYDLESHFSFEEQELFEAIARSESSISKEGRYFLENHENHERRLQLLLRVMREEFTFFSGDLAYQLVLSSLNDLSKSLLEHAEREHELFSKL
ncbi:MAG: hypothetical protein RL226_1275 [Bacteroidota bacterium]|jgi:hypothetical protein